jgi:hypothetical protein
MPTNKTNRTLALIFAMAPLPREPIRGNWGRIFVPTTPLDVDGVLIERVRYEAWCDKTAAKMAAQKIELERP